MLHKLLSNRNISWNSKPIISSCNAAGTFQKLYNELFLLPPGVFCFLNSGVIWFPKQGDFVKEGEKMVHSEPEWENRCI